MSAWHQGKLFIEHSLAIEHDALHMLVGFLAWLLIALVTGRPAASWRPVLWVLALVLWNETVDLWTEQWPDPGMQYGEGVKDVVLTVLVPVVIRMTAKLRPELFRGGTAVRRRR